MKRFLFSFFFLLTSHIHAQELYFKPSAAFQDLPSLETYRTLQDSKGRIWVCSDAGVSRYDGNTLTRFTTKDGLPENVALMMYEDKKGRVWFCTLSGLFCYYDNNSFHSITANPILKNYYHGTSIRSFFIGEKDTLYFGLLDYVHEGITKIPPENNYAKPIFYTTKKIHQSNVIFITNPTKPSEGFSGNGGHYADPGTIYWDNQLYHTPLDLYNYAHANIWTFAINKKKNTLYTPRNLDLVLLKKGDSTVQRYHFNNEMIYIHLDKDGDLWVLFKRGGGYLYKDADLTKKPIHFLNDLSVSSVMVDREGSIWATTLEKGVFVCHSKNLMVIPNQNNERITNLQVDTNRILVSYFSKKLISFFKNDSILKDTAKCVYSSELYLENYYQGNGYIYYDNHNSLFYAQQHKNKIPKSVFLMKDRLRKILPYKEDTVIALTSVRLSLFHHEKNLAVFPLSFVASCIQKLHDGTILIGSRDNKGIFQFKNNQLLPYQPQFKQLKIRINEMVEDKSNRLWLATENGLMCLDENQVLHEFNNPQDPLSLKIMALTVDEQNNIWCSNGNDLIRLQANNDLTHPPITVFNTSHGLPDIRIEKLATFNDTIWCATKDYLFYFKSNSLHKNSEPPLTQLKSIFIDNVNYPLSDVITVNYDQNNITIEATTSTYKSNEPKVFFYKLEGYDKGWQSLNKGIIQYTNLSHGKYTLSVYSLNNDGIKGAPVSFTLIIKRPFWFTWWFILAELVVVCILFYYFLNQWRKRIEKKEHEKAKINQEIAEFKMTALRSQMNPHFIYNAIGSIQHYILKNEIDQSFNYLSKFSSLIRKILNNSRNEYISLEQEISTLQLYIELEQIRFKHPFEFILIIDEQLDMEIDIPTMLIQPYIENSIWHGLMPKETKGCLELTLKKVESTIQIRIKDNGVGRETGDMRKKHHISKGMSLTEQRIQTLENTSNKKFVTTIVDLKDEKGNPTGTEVNLIIPFDE